MFLNCCSSSSVAWRISLDLKSEVCCSVLQWCSPRTCWKRGWKPITLPCWDWATSSFQASSSLCCCALTSGQSTLTSTIIHDDQQEPFFLFGPHWDLFFPVYAQLKEEQPDVFLLQLLGLHLWPWPHHFCHAHLQTRTGTLRSTNLFIKLGSTCILRRDINCEDSSLWILDNIVLKTIIEPKTKKQGGGESTLKDVCLGCISVKTLAHSAEGSTLWLGLMANRVWGKKTHPVSVYLAVEFGSLCRSGKPRCLSFLKRLNKSSQWTSVQTWQQHTLFKYRNTMWISWLCKNFTAVKL